MLYLSEGSSSTLHGSGVRSTKPASIGPGGANRYKNLNETFTNVVEVSFFYVSLPNDFAGKAIPSFINRQNF